MTTLQQHPDPLLQHAQQLGLCGLAEHWHEVPPDLREQLVRWQQDSRRTRSLQRRVGAAKLGRFKAMADFDWTWPKSNNKAQIAELFTLDFVRTGCNAILIGPSGVGKSMICKNLVHDAVMAGYSARLVTASVMLFDLASQPDAKARQQRLKKYTQPDLLAIDEVGYLSYDIRYADLLFEVINGRYQKRSTLVTTNRTFAQWGEIFPNAACVVALVDRLNHHAERVVLEAESWRDKEGKQERASRAQGRERAGAAPARLPAR